jgi:hypothetical protein
MADKCKLCLIAIRMARMGRRQRIYHLKAKARAVLLAHLIHVDSRDSLAGVV